MAIKIGNNNIAAIFKGNVEIKEIYRGNELVFVSGTEAPTLSLVTQRQTQIVLRVTNNDPDTVTFTEIRYGSQTFTSNDTINGNGGTRDFTITGLAIGSPVSFIANVDADGKGLSEDSNTVATTTLAQVAPTISNVSSTSNSITFRLKNNNAEQSVIRARLNLDPISSSTPSATLNAGITSGNLSFTGLNSSTTFSLRAAAFINNIRGPLATPVSVATSMNLGPGPTTLVAGSLNNAGFFGQTTQTQFGRTLTQITSDIGFTTGTAENLNENLLKFIHRGKIKFINKKGFRSGVTWQNLQDRFIANGGNAYSGIILTFGGNSYSVRLMRGWGQVAANQNGTGTPNYSTGPLWPKSWAGNVDSGNNGVNWPDNNSPWNANSPNEWNTLIFPIHVDSFFTTPWIFGNAGQNQTQSVPNWANYTQEELGGFPSNSRGGWMQENAYNATSRIIRGTSNLSGVASRGINDNFFGLGAARLVFELI